MQSYQDENVSLHLMLEDNYNKYYKQGNFVDFYYHDKWIVGKIEKELNNFKVKVVSIFEQNKPEIVYKLDPSKISRFRKHTKATLQFPLETSNPQFILNTLSQKLVNARNLIFFLQNGREKPSTEIFNTLHGELFYIFKFALNPQNHYDKDECDIIIELILKINDIIKDSLTYMKDNSLSIKEYVKSLKDKKEDLVLIKPKLAFVSFIYEIMEIIKILLGENTNFNEYFSYYKKELIEKFHKLYHNKKLNKCCNPKFYSKSSFNNYKIPTIIIAGFIDSFIQNKILDYLFEIIQFQNDYTFSFYYLFLGVFEIIAPYLDYFQTHYCNDVVVLAKNIADQIKSLNEERIQIYWVNRTFKNVLENVLRVTDKSLKIYKKITGLNPLFSYFLIIIKSLEINSSEVHVAVIEKIISLISIILLIKEEKTNENKYKGDKENETSLKQEEIFFFESIELTTFCCFLESHKFFDHLFNLNEFVFPSSLEIFHTMYNTLWKSKENQELSNICEKLWKKVFRDKIDGKTIINEPMIEFMRKFIMELKHQHKEFFLSPFKNYILSEGLSYSNLNYLKKIAISCLNNADPTELNNIEIDKNNPFKIYGMEILWDHIINGIKIVINPNQFQNKEETLIVLDKELEPKKTIKYGAKELMNESVNLLNEIIYHKKLPNSIREKIIHSCFYHKDKVDSITQIYLFIILLFQNKSYFNTFSTSFKQYNEESTKSNEFISHINNDLKRYFSLINLDKPIDENMIFEGIYPYSDNIKLRLQLFFLLCNKEIGLNINFEIFNDIWNVCQKEQHAKNHLYSYFSKYISNIQCYILQELIAQPILTYFPVQSIASFSLLKNIVIEINIQTNKFFALSDTDNTLFKVIPSGKIEGIETLFSILLMEDISNEIKEDIITFLTQICLNIMNYNDENYDAIITYWNSFFELIENSFQNVIQNYNKNENLINNLLSLIVKLTNTVGKSLIINKQQVESLIASVEQLSNEINYILLFKKQNTQTQKEFTITKELSVYQLLNLISFHFKIPRDKIEITITSKEGNVYIINCNNETDIFMNLINLNTEQVLNSQIGENEINSQNQKAINLTNYLVEAKEIDHPIMNIKPSPMECLFNRKEFLNLLETLLNDSKKSYTKQIWTLFKENKVLQSNEEVNEIIYLCSYNQDVDSRKKESQEQTINDIKSKINFENTNILYTSHIISRFQYNIDLYKKDSVFINNLFIKSFIWKKLIKTFFMNYSLLNIDYDGFEERLEKISILNNMILINYCLLLNVKLNEIYKSKAFLEKIIMFIKEINDCQIELNENPSISFAMKTQFDNSINDCICNIFNLLKIKNVVIEVGHFLWNDNLNIDVINLCYTLLSNPIQIAFNDYILYMKELYTNTSKFEIIKKLIKEIVKYFLQETTLNNIEAFANESKLINTLHNFYSMLSDLISKISKIDKEKEIIKDFETIINKFLLNKVISTNQSEDISETVVGGYLHIIYSMLIANPAINIKISINEQNQIENNNKSLEEISFINILIDSLFISKCDNNKNFHLPFIKNNLPYTKKYAYSLLVLLTFTNGSLVKEIFSKLNSYHTMQFWKKENNVNSWNLFSNKGIETRFSKYIGIENLGCTCYINCIIQIFFHIKRFKTALLFCECDNNIKNSLFQLKKLLLNLEHSQKDYIDTLEFCNNFDDIILNPKEQMDIDEFFITFLDKIETHLKLTSNADLIKYFFECTNIDEIVFQNACDFHRKQELSYYSIQLQIKNKSNLYESLQTLIDGEVMDENNKIFCEQCQSKHIALKRQSFKTLPRILMFVLKRFEYDSMTFQRIKLNDYFKYPIELNMTKFTSNYLNSENKEEYIQLHSNDNLYKLKAVVVHIGNIEGGHYLVYIRDDETNTWNKFNDTNVKEFDISNLNTETFGGMEVRHNIDGKEERVEKQKNAYLLFYEKVNQNNCQEYQKVSFETTLFNTQDIIDNIYNDLTIYNVERLLFSREYQIFIIQFMLNSIMLIHEDENAFKTQLLTNTKNQNDFQLTEEQQRMGPIGSNLSHNILNHKLTLYTNHKKKTDKNNLEEIFKFYIVYYFNVVLHTQKDETFTLSCDILKYMLNYSEECSQYLIEEFCNKEVINEYLFECSENNVKKIIIGILYCAMISLHNKVNKNNEINEKHNKRKKSKNISKKEESQVNINNIHPCLLKFIENIMNIIGTKHSEIINDKISVLFHILYRFSSISDAHKILLIDKYNIIKFLESLLNISQNNSFLISTYTELKYIKSNHSILTSHYVSNNQATNDILSNTIQNTNQNNSNDKDNKKISKEGNLLRVKVYQNLLYCSVFKVINKYKKEYSDSEIEMAIQYLLSNIISRQNAYQLAQLIKILSQDSKKFTDFFINGFHSIFKTNLNEYNKYLLIVFKYFLYIKDNLISKRFQKTLCYLIEILTEFVNSIDTLLFYGDFLTKLFHENIHYFASVISKQIKHFCNFLIQFYHQIPPNPDSEENEKMKTRITFVQQLLNYIETHYHSWFNQRKQSFEKNENESISNDVDLTDYKFFFNDKISYNNMEWKVINFIDEMIFVESLNKNHYKILRQWIMTDSEKFILKEPEPKPCEKINSNSDDE